MSVLVRARGIVGAGEAQQPGEISANKWTHGRHAASRDAEVQLDRTPHEGVRGGP